jgi:large repetitive protein
MSPYRYLGTFALAFLMLLVPSGLSVQAQATAGVTITPSTAITTNEGGSTATFSVVLNAAPTASVTIGLFSSDPSEATVSPASLTFSPSNWNVAKVVTVKGVDDQTVDGNIGYTIITTAPSSTDRAYAALNPADIAGTNTDNDTAGFTVTPTSGLTTSEAGATTSFTVALTSKPTRNVNIGVSSSNINEGTVSTSLLVFTSSNWNSAQRVTITGVDDTVTDGSVSYSITTAAAISGDSRYNNLNPADVSVSNGDNDATSVVVTPVSGLTTTEAGGTASFTVALGSKPSANVVIGLSSSNTAEGTVSPASLTFTSANWNVAQRVTVKGVDDKVVDGNKAFTIVTAASVSTDAAFNNINPADVAVTNTDNDVANIVVTPASGLATTEKAGTATFGVKLGSQPTANVMIGLSSSDTTEGTVSPASLTFTSANWSTEQRVTVTGVNDTFTDGNKTYSIITAAATSTDAAYNNRNAVDVGVTNRDDESISFAANVNVNESAGNASLTVQLSGSPETGNNVTVAYATFDKGAVANSDYTAATGTLTFAPGETTKTVTVPITNDTVGEDTESVQVKLTNPVNGVVSADTGTINIQPNDKISFSATSVKVNENVRTTTITVKLNGPNSTQSTSVNYATSNGTATAGSDYTAASGTLTFAANETSKTVVVTIADDTIGEADEQFTLTLSSPVNGTVVTPSTSTVVIATNDPIIFDPSTVTVHENVGNAVITLKLSGGASTQAVSVNYATSDGTAVAGSDYTAASGTVTFNAGQTVKTFTVPVREDALAEGTESVRLTLSSPVNGVLGSATTATLNIQPNDTIGFSMDQFKVIEYEQLATVTVKLNAPSASTVTVNYATSNGTATAGSDYSTINGTLTFAAGETSKTFSVAIMDDAIVDADETINLTLSSATNSVLGKSVATIKISDND